MFTFLLGSCSPKGTITLNIKLIQIPKEYIEYVLIHELCHLKYLHHEPEFYYLLSRVMPDWKRKTNWIDLILGSDFLINAEGVQEYAHSTTHGFKRNVGMIWSKSSSFLTPN